MSFRSKIIITIYFILFFLVAITDPAFAQQSLAKQDFLQSPQSPTSAQAKKTIVVAVIDTGIDLKHKNLENHIWRNQGEVGYDSQGRDRRFNRIDDDHNGFVDDYQGWNFIKESNDVQDQHGHGSHVSGLILTGGDFSTATRSTSASIITTVTGTTPFDSTTDAPIQIMALKYYDSKLDTENTIENTARAIRYATLMGADVINYSGGGYQKSSLEQQAIQLALDKGILFVAAAGNENQNIDQNPFYPASYGLKNIISVGSGSRAKDLDFFSNYGVKNVNILAAGLQVLSTLPDSKMGKLSGTSQSAALVSHTIAKLLSTQEFSPQARIEKVKERLFKSQPINQSIRKIASEAIYLNEDKALTQRNEYEDAYDQDLEQQFQTKEEDFLAENLLLKNFNLQSIAY